MATIAHSTFTIEDAAYTIRCTGLKPMTVHSFYFAGINKGAECRPIGGELGDQLKSDRNGKLHFIFYFDYDPIDPGEYAEFAGRVLASIDMITWSSVQTSTIENIFEVSDDSGESGAIGPLTVHGQYTVSHGMVGNPYNEPIITWG